MSDTPDLPRIWVNLDDCDMDYRPFEGGIEYVLAETAERWRELLRAALPDVRYATWQADITQAARANILVAEIEKALGDE